MNTPIADFVKSYNDKNPIRFHMPGHKGKHLLGCEGFDITEIQGADSLYEAEGIIAESEHNASVLFGTAKTLYSTEGASQCIRAMLYLAMQTTNAKKKIVLASRNAHKAFLYAAALLDLEVVWLYSETAQDSICSLTLTAETVEKKIMQLDEVPVAVYLTSPDYLGGQLDIRSIAEVCHQHGIILTVDNAHGAYLRFLNPSRHPIDLGADICCDSAHKTLPVLTGGAYLQISERAPEYCVMQAKQAMALFGSTSPSYLTLISLDLCNLYLEQVYREKLQKTVDKLKKVRITLRQNGWKVEEREPLKLTIAIPHTKSGFVIANHLSQNGIECEYADARYIVCMSTPENDDCDFAQLISALGVNHEPYIPSSQYEITPGKATMSIREAIFSKCETVPIEQAFGRICAIPSVSCPPAIPIVISGEVIDEQAIAQMRVYGLKTIDVVQIKPDVDTQL